RHTRFSRDWSSDVCSSDLHLLARLFGLRQVPPRELLGGIALTTRLRRERRRRSADRRRRRFLAELPLRKLLERDEHLAAAVLDRSEERRVGKEWRVRWDAD